MLAYYRYRGDTSQVLQCSEQFKNMYLTYRAFVEAANCLLFQASAYNWSEDEMEDTPDIKERLYKTAVKYLGDGKHFEYAVELLREMRAMWQKLADANPKSRIAQNLDAKTQGAQALEEAYIEKAKTRGKLLDQYFFVDFSGHCDMFSKLVEDKKFIVRGSESERLLNFVAKLQTRFPDARIIHQHTAEREGQCIYVHACDPVKVSESFAKSHGLPYTETVVPPGMPLDSTSYYRTTGVNVFLYSRPFLRGQALSPQDKFSNLWICQSYLVTKERFPSISRWCEIVKVVDVEKSPLQNAKDSVAAKTVELLRVMQKAKERPDNTKPLSMVLSGIVDAAVSGGIKHYFNSFLTKEYILTHLDDKRQIEKLIYALLRQKEVIADGLDLHRRVASEPMKLFHAKLEDFYAKWSIEITRVCEDATMYLRQSSRPYDARNEQHSSSSFVSSTGEEQASAIRAIIDEVEHMDDDAESQIKVGQVVHSTGESPTPARGDWLDCSDSSHGAKHARQHRHTRPSQSPAARLPPFLSAEVGGSQASEASGASRSSNSSTCSDTKSNQSSEEDSAERRSKLGSPVVVQDETTTQATTPEEQVAALTKRLEEVRASYQRKFARREERILKRMAEEQKRLHDDLQQMQSEVDVIRTTTGEIRPVLRTIDNPELVKPIKERVKQCMAAIEQLQDHLTQMEEQAEYAKGNLRPHYAAPGSHAKRKQSPAPLALPSVSLTPPSGLTTSPLPLSLPLSLPLPATPPPPPPPLSPLPRTPSRSPSPQPAVHSLGAADEQHPRILQPPIL
eukprot:TRINITY_DN329_c0_g1_i6.p1 TRINITY_DN329_c0_g1~~TRINITY_DN329_c0_g1_i6.p1  ORF type:complete len:913 (+),score=228.34 TRINITY_DN329_c0_g1_i6:368-2740(+)